MARRQLGHGRGGRMKIERDRAEVTGGVRHGRTLGGPVALQVANRDYANWEERMNPWPVGRARSPRCTCRAPATPTWWAPRSTSRPTSATSSSAPRPARRPPAWPAARSARPSCARSASRSARTSSRSPRSHAPPPRARSSSVADFDEVDSSPVRCLDAEATQGDGRGDRRAAQGQRVARRRLRGAGLRPRPGPRLAHLLGGAPRRAPGDGDLLDPGDEGRLDRRRLHGRRPARARRPTTRSSTRPSAATTARPTTRAAWRAA